MSRAPGRPGSGRSAGGALFWLILLVAAYFVPRGQIANADSHLALTYALVEEHTVRIDHFLYTNGPRSPLFDKAVYCGPHTDVQTCRHYYTDKAPGVSLLLAAAYTLVRPILPTSLMPTGPTADRFLLRLLLTLLAITLPCAAFAVSFWRFLAGFGGERLAMLVAVGYVFGTMALPFGMLIFSHALTAALLFWAFILLFGAARGRGEWGPAPAGVLAGYAIGCEYPTVLIAGALGLYALLGDPRGVRARRALIFAMGAVVGLLPLAAYNLIAFGTPLALGYGHVADPRYAQGMAHGLYGVGLPTWTAAWGVTFNPYRGLFILSPWLLPAFPGLRAMARAGLRREAWLCGAVCVVYFLFQAGYYFWDGGESTGPRHFLPALPFLTFPVVFALRTARARRLAAILIGLSAVMLLLVVATEPFYGMQPFPFVQQTLADVAAGKWQNNWGKVLGLRGAASLLPLLIGILLLVRALMRRLPPAAPRIAESLQVGNGPITSSG